jgi:hypothetical protein
VPQEITNFNQFAQVFLELLESDKLGLKAGQTFDMSSGILTARPRAIVETVRNLVDDGSDQAIFPATNDAYSLTAGVRYHFKGQVFFTKGVNSVSTWLLFGGNATYTSFKWITFGSLGVAETSATATINHNEDQTGMAVCPAGTATRGRMQMEGSLVVNAAGTIIPQMLFSAATGSTPTVLPDTWFEIYPIGQSPVTTIGSWG